MSNEKKERIVLDVAYQPQVRTNTDTRRIMLDVIIALLPAVAVAVWQFGAYPLLVIAVSMASAAFFEWGYRKLLKKHSTIGDLSAAVTGLLLALNLPVGIPLWQAIFGALVAIVVVKQLFGGLGKNFANPAITARIVMLLAFSGTMTTWVVPGAADALTGPTPLADPTTLANNIPALFLGNVGGCLGETSALALLIGLVPTNGGSCMKETIQQNFFQTMGHQLQREGYYSVAYHNHFKDFYDRDRTHIHLGYDQFLARYGGLEGISPIWPESDLEMMDITVPQYIDHQPFSVYYMTVSGHCPYSLKENAMSAKNYDKVKDMDCSETIKGYYAANLELEYAMESLVNQLEEAGIADDTVIVLSTDHYPYGLERSSAWHNATDLLKELYGVDSYDNFLRDHNTLIIWSGCIEDQGIQVDDPVYSLDILPTLSNLFGVDYDSRLQVGRDVFSDAEPLVLWPNSSWKTDKGTYNASTSTFTPVEGAEVDDGYVKRISAIVVNKINYSRQVLNLDYFRSLSSTLGITE